MDNSIARYEVYLSLRGLRVSIVINASEARYANDSLGVRNCAIIFVFTYINLP
jgi:hypothetical protein